MRPLDTTEEAWRHVEDGLRKMSPASRAVSLTIVTHAIALAQIRRTHPDEDERRCRLPDRQWRDMVSVLSHRRGAARQPVSR